MFQPMCGRTGAFSCSTTPGHSPQPSASWPCSTPRSKRICMPTQMPSTGRPPARRRSMIRGPSTARSPAMQEAKAPTPGTTRPSASSAACASDVTVTSAPDPGQRPLGRAQVARPVVEDDDLLHAAHGTEQQRAALRGFPGRRMPARPRGLCRLDRAGARAPRTICGQASDLRIQVAGGRPATVDFEHLIERVGGVVSELLSALDALAADDLHALPAAPAAGPHRAARAGA